MAEKRREKEGKGKGWVEVVLVGGSQAPKPSKEWNNNQKGVRKVLLLCCVRVSLHFSSEETQCSTVYVLYDAKAQNAFYKRTLIGTKCLLQGTRYTDKKNA